MVAVDALLERSFWGAREDLHAEFLRLLTSAQDGGATVAECLLAARRMDRDDDSSWFRELTRIAELNRQRGDAAFARGERVTAASNWLRAVNYYLAALFPLRETDARWRASVASMRECAGRHLEVSAGEVVTIPCFEGYALQGYLLPAAGASRPYPTVVCLGEPGHRKEEYLFKLAGHAAARKLTLLACDLWGESDENGLAGAVGHPALESAIPRILDYLSARPDVDADRIAVLGDGWESSFVARGVASDPRIAAAVCGAGIWDEHERDYMARRLQPGGGADIDLRRNSNRIARRISCPTLVTLGERGWLDVERVEELVNAWKSASRDVSLKVFKSCETAAEQGHADNPTLANEFIFDWLAARLSAN